MVSLVFQHPDGQRTQVDATTSRSVMQAALAAGIDEIAADCGGCLNCATCHVWVDEAWLVRLPPPSDEELAMLEMTADERRATSRLSCQLAINDSLDGLIVHLPGTQY